MFGNYAFFLTMTKESEITSNDTRVRNNQQEHRAMSRTHNKKKNTPKLQLQQIQQLQL